VICGTIGILNFLKGLFMTQPSKLRVLHLRYHKDGDVDLYGGMSVAYNWKRGDTFIEVATAVCSKQDLFNRKVGNKLATDAFNDGKTIRVPYRRELQSAGLTPTTYVRSLFASHAFSELN
jgi:hypothetical protein